MSLPTDKEPRMDLEADETRDVLAGQATDYAELSRMYAARRDGRRAALAAWAADVRAVQALLWDADEVWPRLVSVAGAVESTLLGEAASGVASVREVAEAARDALMDALGEPWGGPLRHRLEPLDHLDDVPAPAPGAANQSVTDRLDGRGGEQLVGDLLTAAADCRAVAQVMAQVGDEEERKRQDDAADLAGFEAYLVLVSAATGDATLATTGLRWDLAAVRARRDPALPTRDVVGSVLAPSEREALSAVHDLVRPLPVAG
jgi:hypothetical protein